MNSRAASAIPDYPGDVTPTTNPRPEGIGVLVVEDEDVAAKAHAQYVSRLDGFFVVGIAKNATMALSALSGGIIGLDASRIGLLLLDMNLPDGHGLQLLRSLRARQIDVDTIAVTAARDMAVVQEALSLGVVQYIMKPFTFPAFKSKLEAYVQFRKALGTCTDGTDLTQSAVDAALESLRVGSPRTGTKGVPAGVVDQVTEALAGGAALSAAEMGEAIGVSRVTARRYLEALADAGALDRAPRYGSAGRPVLEYTLVEE